MRFTSNYSLCIYNSFLDKIRQKELGGVILSKDNINYSKECYSEHGVNRQLKLKNHNKQLTSDNNRLREEIKDYIQMCV